MESSFPFALRVAVGVVSEALGALRRLPTDIATLPVTVIGRVAKLSFQLNQQLTELAAEGDQLLDSLQTPVAPPERTVWSTIDDEADVAANDPQAAATWDSVEDAREEGLDADPATSAAAEPDSPARLLVEDVELLEVGAQPSEVTELTAPISQALVDHNSMTLAQLRSRVRTMPVEQVRAALAREETGLARPAFLTILSNRLSTLARSSGE